ncbi:unnamed protein product [Prorocentrum cordatum]|uniref:EF-hand domain-containing protein n=1 Tax=Prorocentrum cordatum TaxID=2364126 RepID=A0ABN9V608_9DINO|nr:unnamed protein product [Polarella glacialis]
MGEPQEADRAGDGMSIQRVVRFGGAAAAETGEPEEADRAGDGMSIQRVVRFGGAAAAETGEPEEADRAGDGMSIQRVVRFGGAAAAETGEPEEVEVSGDGIQRVASDGIQRVKSSKSNTRTPGAALARAPSATAALATARASGRTTERGHGPAGCGSRRRDVAQVVRLERLSGRAGDAADRHFQRVQPQRGVRLGTAWGGAGAGRDGQRGQPLPQPLPSHAAAHGPPAAGREEEVVLRGGGWAHLAATRAAALVQEQEHGGARLEEEQAAALRRAVHLLRGAGGRERRGRLQESAREFFLVCSERTIKLAAPTRDSMKCWVTALLHLSRQARKRIKTNSLKGVPSAVVREFARLDINGTGGIEVDQLTELMKSMNLSTSVATVRDLFDEFDKDRNGLLDLGEFASFFEYLNSKESLLEWFNRYASMVPLRGPSAERQLRAGPDAPPDRSYSELALAMSASAYLRFLSEVQGESPLDHGIPSPSTGLGLPTC